MRKHALLVVHLRIIPSLPREEAVGNGAHGFADADASAVGGAAPNAGPVDAPNVGPAVAPDVLPVVVAPIREFMNADHGSGGCEGGALRGDPN